MEGVYLLHFDEPLRRDDRAVVSHYLGFSSRIEDRLHHHVNGNGNGLVAAAARKGAIRLVRVWLHGDRNYERALKNQRNAPRFCPICCAREGRGIRNTLPPGRRNVLRAEHDLMRQALKDWREQGSP
jgi:hypothetical protein